MATDYHHPAGWFTRNVFNRLVALLTRQGISVLGSRVLAVKGRTSGEWRTTPVNLLGLPAAAVPTGLADGLPTGVQVIGNRFREDLCLAAAEAIEARLGVLTPVDPR